MTRVTLCVNCLESGAAPVAVGPDKGNQFDSYRDTIDLCFICKDALYAGDFETLASRHTNERILRVGAQGEH